MPDDPTIRNAPSEAIAEVIAWTHLEARDEEERMTRVQAEDEARRLIANKPGRR